MKMLGTPHYGSCSALEMCPDFVDDQAAIEAAYVGNPEVLAEKDAPFTPKTPVTPAKVPQVTSFEARRAAYAGYPDIIADIDREEDEVESIANMQLSPDGHPLIVDGARLGRPELIKDALDDFTRQAAILIATVARGAHVRREHQRAAEILLAHKGTSYPKMVAAWLGAITAREIPDLESPAA